jgi:hypothetical protein
MCDTFILDSSAQGEGPVYDVMGELSVHSQSDKSYKTTAGCSDRRRPIEEDPPSDRLLPMRTALTRE